MEDRWPSRERSRHKGHSRTRRARPRPAILPDGAGGGVTISHHLPFLIQQCRWGDSPRTRRGSRRRSRTLWDPRSRNAPAWGGGTAPGNSRARWAHRVPAPCTGTPCGPMSTTSMDKAIYDPVAFFLHQYEVERLDPLISLHEPMQVSLYSQLLCVRRVRSAVSYQVRSKKIRCDRSSPC